jgi:hypothetical protein
LLTNQIIIKANTLNGLEAVHLATVKPAVQAEPAMLLELIQTDFASFVGQASIQKKVQQGAPIVPLEHL